MPLALVPELGNSSKQMLYGQPYAFFYQSLSQRFSSRDNLSLCGQFAKGQKAVLQDGKYFVVEFVLEN